MNDPRSDKIRRLLPKIEAAIGEPESNAASDPLGELVGTILSQNTSDTNSHRAYAALGERFPTWSEVRDADRADLIDAIRVGGLAETKAETIQTVLRELPIRNGEPSLDHLDALSDEEALAYLSSFKGIGIKTAACVLVFGLGRDVCPVDTHVHRVSNRLGLARTTSPDQTHRELNPLIPNGDAYRFHVLFVRFGRRICHARRPRCHECPVYDECAVEERHAFAADHLERERG